jgi:aminocarboxymuconate-semialdehyde decarboxylase
LGARAINIGTDNLAGRNLDDEQLFPLYAKLQELDLPLFLHPYPSPMETGGIDKYNLSWIAGYVHQETVAFCTLVFGGILDSFSRLKVCIPHGGGSVPYQVGRLEYALSKMPDVRAKRPLREYLKNFYFDVLIHDLKARRYLIDFMGADNLVMGDNYLGWDAVDGFALLDELNLPESEHRKICGGNAIELFKLR